MAALTTNNWLFRRQPRYDFFERSVGPGFDCFPGLVLNRMRDVHGVEVRPAERACLRPRRQHELARRHRHRRDP